MSSTTSGRRGALALGALATVGILGIGVAGCGAAVTGGVLGILSGQDDSRDDPVNNPPAVSVSTPTGAVNDVVTIGFRLTDPESDRANVRVEFSTNGTDYQAATPAFVEGSLGTSNLITSPTGVDHQFFWNTSAPTDIGIQNGSGITVRITPVSASNLSQEGAPATTDPFSVSNLFITTLTRRPPDEALVPLGLAFDSSDNLFVADGGHRVVKIERQSGAVTVLAGNGEAGQNGDKILASQAQLNTPIGLGVTASGAVVLADSGNEQVRVIDTNQYITRQAGGGAESGDGALPAEIGVFAIDAAVAPRDLALDRFGNPFILEAGRLRIFNLQSTPNLQFPIDAGDCAGLGGPPVVAPARIFSLLSLAGAGTSLPAPALCLNSLERAVALAVQDVSDAERVVYVLEAGESTNDPNLPRLLAVNLGTSAVTLHSTVTGSPVVVQPGMVDVVAGRSQLLTGGFVVGAFPDMALVSGGVLLMSSEQFGHIRAFNLTSAPVLVAGTSVPSASFSEVIGNGSFGDEGDGGDPLQAALVAPLSVGVDGQGNIFVGETTGRIRVVPVQSLTFGNVTIAAGKIGSIDSALPDFDETKFGIPLTVAATPAGDLVVSDRDGRLRLVSGKDASDVKVVLGSGLNGDLGDGGPATQARIGDLGYCSARADGLIVAPDVSHDRIRAVNTSTTPITFLGVTIAPGNVETVVGTGVASVNSQVGDGGPPSQATVSRVVATQFDSQGLLWFGDTGNLRVRVCNPTAQAVTVFGVTIQPDTIQTVIGTGDLATGDDAVDGVGGPVGQALLDGHIPFFGPDGRLYLFLGFGVAVVNQGTAPLTVGGGITIAPGTFQYVAGGGQPLAGVVPVEGEPALGARLLGRGFAARSDGVVFMNNELTHRIRAANLGLQPVTIGGVVIQPGTIHTVVGVGAPSFDGDPSRVAAGLFGVQPGQGGPIDLPFGLAAFDDGRLLLVDSENGAVRMVNLADEVRSFGGIQAQPGQMVVVAGSRTGRTRAGGPVDVEVDAGGLVVFSDNGPVGRDPALLQLDPISRLVTRLAGTGERTHPAQIDLGDGGPARLATFAQVAGIHMDSEGSIYVADTGNRRVRFVNRSGGSRTPFAGVTVGDGHIDTLLSGFMQGDGDGTNDDNLLVTDPTFDLFDPIGVSEAGGFLWIVDEGPGHRLLRVETATGRVQGVIQSEQVLLTSFAGGIADTLVAPSPTVSDGTADFITAGVQPGDTLRVFIIAGTTFQANMSTEPLPADVTVASVTNATTLTLESNVAEDSGGGAPNITYQLLRVREATAVTAASGTVAYVAFRAGQAGFVERVERVGGTFTRTIVAGTGQAVWNGDSLPAAAMSLGEVRGLHYDATSDVLYVSDAGNHRIVAINLGSAPVVVAGVSIDANHARTVCGSGKGEPGFNGDAGPPQLALLNQPTGVALGATGQVVVVDAGNGRLRRFQGK